MSLLYKPAPVNWELVATLPPATEAEQGRPLLVRTEEDEKTKAYVCVENSNNEFEWIQTGVST